MADKLQRFHANLETSAQPAIRKTKISILASIVSPLSVAFSVATASTLSFASPAPQCRNLFASHSFDSQDHAQLLISQFNAQFGESFRDGSILTKPLNRSQFEYLVSPLIRAVDRQINSIDLLENKSRRLTSAQKSNFAQAKSNLVNLKSQFEKLSRSSAKPFHYESVFDAIQRSVSAVIDPTSKLIASPAASASLKIV
jgi:hypothetical protein